jgi:hypothetical protein
MMTAFWQGRGGYFYLRVDSALWPCQNNPGENYFRLKEFLCKALKPLPRQIILPEASS